MNKSYLMMDKKHFNLKDEFLKDFYEKWLKNKYLYKFII